MITSPIICSNIFLVIKPGRKIVGTSPLTSMIVDSIPIPTGPPSIIYSIFPFISSITCSAFVGDGLPEVFALGAATYTPDCRIRESAAGWEGIRIATVSNPPVVPCGTISFLGNIIVNGPGQKACANAYAFSFGYPSTSRSCTSAMCTINGLSDGLPFAA